MNRTTVGRAGSAGAGTANDPLRQTRVSGVWVGVVAFVVVLTLLVVFIAQNTQSVQVRYFGVTLDLSLAIAMLLAAIAGMLLAATAGALRIWQLRRRLRDVTRR
jgi:uncharacterized integral membrane protein